MVFGLGGHRSAPRPRRPVCHVIDSYRLLSLYRTISAERGTVGVNLLATL